MKVLLNCHVPFMLAHGGAQIQIEQTKAALEKVGLEVEFLRWWDDTQTGDILQHFGRVPSSLLRLAQEKGMKVVIVDLLTQQGSRSRARLSFQRTVTRTIERTWPKMITASFNWDSYRLADACVANTAWEKHLMTYLFGAPPEKVHVVPNGVEEIFLNSPPVERGRWLVCTATITPRKKVLELAQAAVAARTPLWVLGKAYSESDEYARKFVQLARQHPETIRYEGAVSDRKKLAEIYRAARGFVLISTMETRSLSSEEAAACQCPLLLSDLPWARSVFGEQATYCPVTDSTPQIAEALRKFYEAAPTLKPPAKPLSWVEVGQQFKAVYEGLFKTSR
jgi:glycosyltransferase involved in cell wall biosynthesis